MEKSLSVNIYGCGNMAQGIFLALKKNRSLAIHTYTPSYHRAKLLADALGGVAHREVRSMPLAKYYFLGMKPHDFDSFCSQLIPLLQANGVVISIMAGISLVHLRDKLGVSKVVRVMPNLPCRVGRGLSLFHSSSEVELGEEREVVSLFEGCSRVVECAEEEQLDRGMVVSGCGPGYLLELAMVMSQYLEQHCFSKEDSRVVVQELFSGTSLLMEQLKEESLAQLRDRVTSKGGTTQAALNDLRRGGLWKAWEQALDCAYERGREIGRGEK